MSDTPETDYLWSNSLISPEEIRAKFKEIERERNALKQKLSGRIEMGTVCIASKEFIDGITEDRDKLIEINAALIKALETIEEWSDFPPTGRFNEDGSEMSYGLLWGSNGERNYMRGVAYAAIQKGQELLNKIDPKIP